MTKEDLLGKIDELLTDIDEAVARGPSDEQQKELDQLADKLTDAQGKVAKAIIEGNDPKYKEPYDKLADVNAKIRADLVAVAALAVILDGIKQGVELVMAILKLAGEV